jgi:peptide/nickel transport system substrate-binding protein
MGSDPSLWTVPCGFFPPASPMASDAGMSVLAGKRDYAKVKRDLEAAGYKGEKVVFMVPVEFPTLKAIGDVAADMLTRVGMAVDYQATDASTLFQRRASQKPLEQGGWSLFCTGVSGIDFFTPATHQPLRGNGPQAWPGWPASPRLEALRDTWFDAQDLDTQKLVAADIQRQAFLDVPYYPLGITYIPSAYRTDLDGILSGFPIFWNVRRI